MESSPPPAWKTRQKWAISLCAAQILTAFAAAIAAAIEVESVIVTGPLLAVIGLVLAIVTRPIQTWATLLFALSGPFVAAVVAFAIALFELSPRAAEGPVVIIHLLYLLMLGLPAIAEFRQIAQWRVQPLVKRPWVWRYSMKSMLAVMTFVALITAVLAGVTDGFSDYVAFALFGSTYISACAVLIWHFYSSRRGLEFLPSAPRLFTTATRHHNIFHNGLAAPRCSFCGSAYREAGPFAEGRDGSLICGPCAARCHELVGDELAKSSVGGANV